MAVPFLALLNGLIPVILILVLAYGLSLLLHLMITEMVMRDAESTQLVETFGKFLFRQKYGALFTWIFFGLVVLNFYALLTAFIVGWGNAIGPWAITMGSGFVFLAIMTSYWSTSYALAIVIEERLKWDYRLCWLVATLPTLVLAMANITGFLGFMRIAGGLLAVLISIMVIPAYRGSIKYGTNQMPEFKQNFTIKKQPAGGELVA